MTATAPPILFHFTEQPYPGAWNDHGGSLRVNLPNRKCEPEIAADLGAYLAETLLTGMPGFLGAYGSRPRGHVWPMRLAPGESDGPPPIA